MMDSALGTEKVLSIKADEHHAAENSTSAHTEKSNRLTARSRRSSGTTLVIDRDIDDGVKSDCFDKVSGKYKTAAIVLSVLIGLEILFALLWVCFRSLLVAVVGLYLG